MKERQENFVLLTLLIHNDSQTEATTGHTARERERTTLHQKYRAAKNFNPRLHSKQRSKPSWESCMLT